ncbi:hypothetical protein IP91_03010 [Pseudoduganella lurida]|uniref:Uncharacterized protein n=2 Tax=Pseudoduganella lurida TaxID=1036180 RepID=A0A562R6P3_9BURK|nr:hypothetical protein IP91_03010 [Pseudoduganella lurida]
MFPPVTIHLSPTTMIAFLQHIEAACGAVDASQVADEAIRQWLERQGDRAAPGAPRLVPKGYHWKCLYVPEGTLVKLWRYPEYGQAEVIGDRLVFKGEHTSPNKFVLGCTGTIRNAWLEISLLMPGEKRWFCARDRRWRIFSEARPPVRAGKPLPPPEEIQPWDWRFLPAAERIFEPTKPPKCLPQVTS